MRILRRDFIPENTQSYCNRPLNSGKAYYMLDDNGNTHYAGDVCARQNADEETDFNNIIDLTKGMIAFDEQRGGYGGGGNGGRNPQNNPRAAITYLILRQDILPNFGFEGTSYNVFNEYYQYYLDNNELNEDQVNHIININKYSTNSDKDFLKRRSLNNLQVCHAYYFYLNRILEHLKTQNQEVKFTQGLINYLAKNLILKDTQIKGLDGWIQYLPRELQNATLRNFVR